MDNLELPRATENIEAKDSSTEGRSLKDATFDSGGYVERSQTIQEAESVESNFVTMIDGAINPAGQTAEGEEASQASFKPAHLIKSVDPSTGQSSSEEGSPRSTGEASPVYAGGEKDPTGVGALNQGSNLKTIGDDQPDYQNEHAAPDVPDRVAWDADEEGGAGTLADGLAGAGKQGASDHKDLDPYNIDHELPEAKIKALGQGPQGLIQGDAAHGGLVGGNYPGSGSPLGSGGSHSSGGGPPVGAYGPGSVGEGKTTWKSTHEKNGKVSEQEGETSNSCESVKDSAKSIAERESGKGGSGSTTINCADGNTTYKVKYNPDGWSVTKTYQKSWRGGLPCLTPAAAAGIRPRSHMVQKPVRIGRPACSECSREARPIKKYTWAWDPAAVPPSALAEAVKRTTPENSTAACTAVLTAPTTLTIPITTRQTFLQRL